MSYRKDENPFYVDKGRAMVSLGPLNEKKYCAYSCAFCYVQSGFWKYEKMSIEGICDFLKINEDKFKIIYISGDTDSFAPPRTLKGIELLTRIAQEFNKDLLFTTRAVFGNEEIDKIQKVDKLLKGKNQNLFACVSISSPCGDINIEPFPISSIQERINQLDLFKKLGIFSILAMRPFLPLYTYEEYVSLINRVKGRVDCILGERWYYHENDIIYSRVMGDQKISRGEITLEKMDFDDNESEWNIWYDEYLEMRIMQYCNECNIPFYMRSSPAIDYLKTLRGDVIDGKAN